jgi:hypothetical protein
MGGQLFAQICANIDTTKSKLVMQRSIFTLALLCLVGLTQCNKEEIFTKYANLVYRQYFDIPAGVGIFDVHHFYINQIPTKYLTSLTQSGLQKNEVTKVLMSEGSISSLFGDGDLSFVDRISIRAYADGDPTNYIEIAYRDPSPVDPGTSIGLIPSLASAQEFFQADFVNIDVVIYLRETTTESVNMQLDLTMRAGY